MHFIFILCFFQTLPDQQHCYFLTDSNLKGVFIQNIKFTHPSQVSRIITYLRQQALFNCLIRSCVRPECQQGNLKYNLIESQFF